MKKLILIGLLIGTANVVTASEYIETRLGLNTLGTYNYNTHEATVKDKTKGVGADFALEFMDSIHENLYLGAGIAYQVNEEHKAKKNPLFKSVPIYGAVKYGLGYIGESSWETYLKGNLGYSINIKDGGKHTPKDGLYWALGGGIENDGVILEISYQDTYSEVNHTNYDYSRWTFGIGYRFRNL